MRVVFFKLFTCICMPRHTCGDQRTTCRRLLSLPTMWSSGTELRSLGWAASSFSLSSHQPCNILFPFGKVVSPLKILSFPLKICRQGKTHYDIQVYRFTHLHSVCIYARARCHVMIGIHFESCLFSWWHFVSRLRYTYTKMTMTSLGDQMLWDHYLPSL